MYKENQKSMIQWTLRAQRVLQRKRLLTEFRAAEKTNRLEAGKCPLEFGN